METKNLRGEIQAQHPLAVLRKHLGRLRPGRVDDAGALIPLLKAAWDDLDGSDSEGMMAYKLERIEDVAWNPPELSFVMERHGGTVMGSTRAKLHHWTVDVSRGEAQCAEAGYRQLYPRDAPFHARPVATEIVALITADADDPRLRWSKDRSEVRVLISEFVGGQNAQTQQGRRKRFRKELQARLETVGWSKVMGRSDTFRREA